MGSGAGQTLFGSFAQGDARYACLAEPELDEKIFASALQKLNEGELLELKRVYQAREEHAAEQPQLSYGARERSMADGSAFLI